MTAKNPTVTAATVRYAFAMDRVQAGFVELGEAMRELNEAAREFEHAAEGRPLPEATETDALLKRLRP